MGERGSGREREIDREERERSEGLGFRVLGSGFRVQGAGFRVQGSGFRVQGLGLPGRGCSRGRGKWPGTPHTSGSAGREGKREELGERGR